LSQFYREQVLQRTLSVPIIVNTFYRNTFYRGHSLFTESVCCLSVLSSVTSKTYTLFIYFSPHTYPRTNPTLHLHTCPPTQTKHTHSFTRTRPPPNTPYTRTHTVASYNSALNSPREMWSEQDRERDEVCRL